MNLKYSIDDKITIEARVLEIVADDKGVFYKLKVPTSGTAIQLTVREDQIIGGLSAD